MGRYAVSVAAIIRDPGNRGIRSRSEAMGADVMEAVDRPQRPVAGTATGLRRLVAVLVLLLAGCVSRPEVDVALIGLAPVESTLLEQRLRLDFRLQNFGERAISARGLDVALYVNGRRLARGVDNDPFHLEGLGETRISAVVSTSLAEVARQILELRQRETFDYRLEGRVHLNGWPRSAAFSRSGEISRSDLAALAGIGGRTPRPLRLE